MYRKEATIMNETGLHARPATLFIQEVKKYSSNITIQNLNMENSAPVSAKSVIMLMALGLSKGTKICLCAEGPDEKEAVDELADFIENKLAESEK